MLADYTEVFFFFRRKISKRSCLFQFEQQLPSDVKAGRAQRVLARPSQPVAWGLGTAALLEKTLMGGGDPFSAGGRAHLQ